MKDYIAYQGERFQIEWYYDVKGNSQALKYATDKLKKVEKARLLLLFERMGDLGKINDITKFRNEGDGVYAFKPKPHRFLCFFFEGGRGKIIITNAFEKRKDKLPNREKTRALDTREEYKERIKKGTYYEED